MIWAMWKGCERTAIQVTSQHELPGLLTGQRRVGMKEQENVEVRPCLGEVRTTGPGGYQDVASKVRSQCTGKNCSEKRMSPPHPESAAATLSSVRR